MQSRRRASIRRRVRRRPWRGAVDACGRQFFNDGGGRSSLPCLRGGPPRRRVRLSIRRRVSACRRTDCLMNRRMPVPSLGVRACQMFLEIVANRSARELAWLYFLMMPAISSGRR